MAYGFNDDKSKRNVVSARQIRQSSSAGALTDILTMTTNVQVADPISAGGYVEVEVPCYVQGYYIIGVLQIDIRAGALREGKTPITGYRLTGLGDQQKLVIGIRNATNTALSALSVYVTLSYISNQIISS